MDTNILSQDIFIHLTDIQDLMAEMQKGTDWSKSEAIKQARILRDTEIPDDVMVGWLSAHDGTVWDEVHANYEGPEPREKCPVCQQPAEKFRREEG